MGDPAFDLLQAARTGGDRQYGVQSGNGNESDGRLPRLGVPFENTLQLAYQVGGPAVLQRIDADALAAEHVRVEDLDQLEQLADVGGSVGDDQKVGRLVKGDIAASRQVGREQFRHVAGRHEVQGNDLKHPAVPRGGGGGARLPPDVQGQLLDVPAGKDAVYGTGLDHGDTVDLQDGLEKGHEVAASHLAVGEDVDHSLDIGIDDVVQLQLVGDVADELQQVAIHAIEPEAGVGCGGARSRPALGRRRIGIRLRIGSSGRIGSGGLAGSRRALPGFDRVGSSLRGVGSRFGPGLADGPERRLDQLELRLRFRGLLFRVLSLGRRGLCGLAGFAFFGQGREGGQEPQTNQQQSKTPPD